VSGLQDRFGLLCCCCNLDLKTAFLNLGLHMKVVGLCLIFPYIYNRPKSKIYSSRYHPITEQCSSLDYTNHLFSKFAHLFVLSISVLQLINQFFHLCDRPAFKMNIYHKLKVSYIIRYVIIKHALVKELLILQVQNDDIKPW